MENRKETNSNLSIVFGMTFSLWFNLQEVWGLLFFPPSGPILSKSINENV